MCVHAVCCALHKYTKSHVDEYVNMYIHEHMFAYVSTADVVVRERVHACHVAA